MSDSQAQGRLPGEPVAIVDIGSNSVRLVSYKSQSRAPTPTFNEKALCGLGKGVAMTGLLPEDGGRQDAGRTSALSRSLRHNADQRRARHRDRRGSRRGATDRSFSRSRSAPSAAISNCSVASRKPDFRRSGSPASIHRADGIVGDLGGGSLELTEVKNGERRPGVDPPARRAVTDGSFRAIAEKGGEDRP